jgi:hypothetical protein
MWHRVFSAVALLSVLTACGSGDEHELDHGPLRPVSPYFDLYGFDVIDSYGRDSALDSRRLLVDSQKAGRFQAYWRLSASDAYDATLLVADVADTRNAREITRVACPNASYCGYNEGKFYCSATQRNEIVCDGRSAYVGDWLRRSNQLVLILRLCNNYASRCYDEFQEVTVE